MSEPLTSPDGPSGGQRPGGRHFVRHRIVGWELPDCAAEQVPGEADVDLGDDGPVNAGRDVAVDRPSDAGSVPVDEPVVPVVEPVVPVLESAEAVVEPVPAAGSEPVVESAEPVAVVEPVRAVEPESAPLPSPAVESVPAAADRNFGLRSMPARIVGRSDGELVPAAAGRDAASQEADDRETAGWEAASAEPGIDSSEHDSAVRHWRDLSRRRRKPKPKRPFWIELPILIVVAFVLTFLIQTFIAKVYYVPSGSMELTLHGTPSGGDRILAYKLVYDFRDPAQSDVVVFKGPDTWAPEADIPGPTSFFGKAIQAIGSVIGIAPPNEKDFVKRVIAVGGQTVSCCDLDGNLVVDHHSLNEPYIYQPIPFEKGVADCTVDPANPSQYESRRCFAPYTVPMGQLWVMGDHRSESSDSSVNCLGLTPEGVAQRQQARGDHQTCQRPIPASDVIGKAIAIVMPPSRWGTIGNPDLMGPPATQGSGIVAAVPAAGGVIGALGLRGLVALLPGQRRRRRLSRFGRPAGRAGREGPSRS